MNIIHNNGKTSIYDSGGKQLKVTKFQLSQEIGQHPTLYMKVILDQGDAISINGEMHAKNPHCNICDSLDFMCEKCCSQILL